MGGIQYLSSKTLDARSKSWLDQLEDYHRRDPLTTLDHAALIVIDMQRYFLDPSSHAFLPAAPIVLPRILKLAQSFREAGLPIIATTHRGKNDSAMTRFWRGSVLTPKDQEFISEIEDLKPDHLIVKDHYSAFFQTDLAEFLTERSCQKVVICGLSTHLCCEATAKDALAHNLDVIVAADGCVSFDEDLHLNALKALSHGVATISTQKEISSTLGVSEKENTTEPSIQLNNDILIDLAIIGAGPAGIAAALQAKRHNLKIKLYDRNGIGGWASAADAIYNYPGFSGGISGKALVRRFQTQLESVEIEIEQFDVQRIVESNEGFEIHSSSGEKQHAKAVIVATGTQSKTDPLYEQPAIQPFLYQRADQIPQKKNLNILIVGGGEAAFDQAIHLAKRGVRCTLFARGSISALAIQQEEAKTLDIAILENTPIEKLSINDNDRLVANQHPQTFDGLLLAIGKEPLAPHLPKDAFTIDSSGLSAIPGLYLAGDLRRGPFRQIAIAVGDGVLAAMQAFRYLNRYKETNKKI